MRYTKPEEYHYVPWIHDGYRKLDSVDCKSIIKHLLSWHNETLNIWTLISIPVMSWWMFFTSRVYWHMSNTETYILAVMPISVTLHCIASAGNHTVASYNAAICKLFKRLDVCATYWASTLYAILFNSLVYGQSLWTIIISLFTLSVSTWLSWSEFQRNNSNLYKTIATSVLVTCYMIPLIDSHYNGILTSIVLLLGGIFYGLQIPERIWPGKFDFIFHGNQLMHYCLIAAHYLKFQIIEYILCEL